jgi:signal transduction histidine kinase
MKSNFTKLDFKHGEETFSLSRPIRQKILTQLAAALVVVLVLYFTIDKIIGLHVETSIFIGLLVLSITIFFLNRKGHFRTAASIGLVLFNLFIYSMASSEKYEAALHLHLILAGLVALILFGNEDRWLAYIFVFFTGTLYLLNALTDFSFLEYRNFSVSQIKILLIINSVIYSSVSTSLVFMVLRLNYKAEKSLIAKQAETTLQNEKLKKANSELDRFVYSASHDLRAPLSSISGLIGLAQHEPTAMPQYLVMMQDRVGVMDRFIREIIDYSRNARLDLQIEKFNLKKLIEDVVEVLKFAPHRDHIKIEMNVPGDLTISSDRSRLNVTLSNLISNAVKYQDLYKENSYLKIHCTKEGNNCIIRLEDNGIGIKEEHQPKIFDMFYRATEKSKGSGLGLYIVKETLDKLSGNISFQSSYGEGTTFTVVIPS